MGKLKKKRASEEVWSHSLHSNVTLRKVIQTHNVTYAQERNADVKGIISKHSMFVIKRKKEKEKPGNCEPIYLICCLLYLSVAECFSIKRWSGREKTHST